MNIGPVGPQRTMMGRQRALMRWYRRYGRHHLPWRKTRDPYAILVSEIMLQQTQVDRVIPYWTQWMRRWPTIKALARAQRASVIRAWAGLGYNRRAVYLHAFARHIVRHGLAGVGEGFTPSHPGGRKAHPYDSPFAFSHENAKDISGWARGLQRLPGVGPYTANALLAFAWNLPAPCVDTNVRRVLAYAIYRKPAIMRMPLRQVMRLAARVIPKGRGRDWNYALMDYGALVLTARDIPKCPKLGLGHFGHERKIERFAGSPRFWRGRLVAVLRDAPKRGLTAVALHHALRAYGVPPRLASLLRALADDGLVARRGVRYHLA